MRKLDLAVHFQDVVLEVPEGDLVELDITVIILISLYWFVLKNYDISILFSCKIRLYYRWEKSVNKALLAPFGCALCVQAQLCKL